jgi:hypothetical protein
LYKPSVDLRPLVVQVSCRINVALRKRRPAVRDGLHDAVDVVLVVEAENVPEFVKGDGEEALVARPRPTTVQHDVCLVDLPAAEACLANHAALEGLPRERANRVTVDGAGARTITSEGDW